MGTLAAGIKEIFATAKTTGSNVLLCGNDGTPDGHITMDNLANVLGRFIKQTGATTIGDNNTLATVYSNMTGYFCPLQFIDNTDTETSSFRAGSTGFILKWDKFAGVVFAFRYDEDKIYLKRKYGPTFTPWKQISLT